MCQSGPPTTLHCGTAGRTLGGLQKYPVLPIWQKSLHTIQKDLYRQTGIRQNGVLCERTQRWETTASEHQSRTSIAPLARIPRGAMRTLSVPCPVARCATRFTSHLRRPARAFGSSRRQEKRLLVCTRGRQGRVWNQEIPFDRCEDCPSGTLGTVDKLRTDCNQKGVICEKAINGGHGRDGGAMLVDPSTGP